METLVFVNRRGISMSAMSYPYEKLMVAVDAMATSPQRIQDRLHSAYMSFHPLRPTDFPEGKMRVAYVEIMDRLTRVKDADPDKGFVRATLDRMSDEDAGNLASKIFDLFLDVARERFEA